MVVFAVQIQRWQLLRFCAIKLKNVNKIEKKTKQHKSKWHTKSKTHKEDVRKKKNVSTGTKLRSRLLFKVVYLTCKVSTPPNSSSPLKKKKKINK
jgi:hypothetical protein